MTPPYGYEHEVADYLGIEGLWRPIGAGECKILWPAIYSWKERFVGRPWESLCPKREWIFEFLNGGGHLRFPTHSELAWVASKTEGMLQWIDQMDVVDPGITGAPKPVKYELCCVVERGRPNDLRLVNNIVEHPEQYTDWENARVLLIELHPDAGQTSLHKWQFMHKRLQYAAPQSPAEIVDYIARSRHYIEVQNTWGPTLWSLIAQKSRRMVSGPKWGGWAEWSQSCLLYTSPSPRD